MKENCYKQVFSRTLPLELLIFFSTGQNKRKVKIFIL